MLLTQHHSSNYPNLSALPSWGAEAQSKTLQCSTMEAEGLQAARHRSGQLAHQQRALKCQCWLLGLCSLPQLHHACSANREATIADTAAEQTVVPGTGGAGDATCLLNHVEGWSWQLPPAALPKELAELSGDKDASALNCCSAVWTDGFGIYIYV